MTVYINLKFIEITADQGTTCGLGGLATLDVSQLELTAEIAGPGIYKKYFLWTISDIENYAQLLT